MEALPIAFVDSNEAIESKPFIHHMKDYFGEERIVIQPEPTDVVLFTKRGNCLIERKVFPSDFLASLRDDRLKKQAQLMLDAPGGAFILEGNINLTPDGKIRDGARVRDYTYRQVVGVIMSLEDAGIKVLWSPGVAWTPHVVHECYTWWTKEKHEMLSRRARPQWAWGAPSEQEQAVYALQGFGLGPVTAKAALATLGSVEAVLTADDATLKSVHGLGPTRIQKMRKIWQTAHQDGNL